MKIIKKKKRVESDYLKMIASEFEAFREHVTFDVILPSGTKVPDVVKSLKKPKFEY
jgi:hypothetical protein